MTLNFLRTAIFHIYASKNQLEAARVLTGEEKAKLFVSLERCVLRT